MLNKPGTRAHNILLPLEGLAGSRVEDVAEEMLQVAGALGLGVTLQINGTSLTAFPHTKIEDLRADYERQLAAC